jgi:phage baseplate assembly protein W
MAILVGPKLVKDLPEKDRVAIGITLPLQRGNNGFFNQSFQTIDQVKSNIKNLILTRRGERLMHPTFGTDLYNSLFNQNTDDLELEIQTSIESAIAEWMPFISIEEILVDQSNTDRDRYFFTVSLKFTVAGQQNLETVTFNVIE